MVRSLALNLILFASACSYAYKAELPPEVDAAPDAPPAFDRCAFQGYDDPNRYGIVSSTSAAALPWEEARAACIRRGMDLAVMNDAREIGGFEADAWPAWVGVSQVNSSSPWVAVDGCPALSPDQAATAPVGVTAGSDLNPNPSCGVVGTANQVDPNQCDGFIPVGGTGPIVRALCETPRPDSAACADAGSDEAVKHASYETSPSPLSYADAVTYCGGLGMHLVVVDSTAELKNISQSIPRVVAADFWIGDRWDGTGWKTETGCPGQLTWFDGGVTTNTLGGGAACAVETVTMGPADDPDNPPVVGARGMALVGCGELKLALCERP